MPISSTLTQLQAIPDQLFNVSGWKTIEILSILWVCKSKGNELFSILLSRKKSILAIMKEEVKCHQEYNI